MGKVAVPLIEPAGAVAVAPKAWQSRCFKGQLVFKVFGSTNEYFDQLMPFPCDDETLGNQWDNMKKITEFKP